MWSIRGVRPPDDQRGKVNPLESLKKKKKVPTPPELAFSIPHFDPLPRQKWFYWMGQDSVVQSKFCEERL